VSLRASNRQQWAFWRLLTWCPDPSRTIFVFRFNIANRFVLGIAPSRRQRGYNAAVTVNPCGQVFEHACAAAVAGGGGGWDSGRHYGDGRGVCDPGADVPVPDGSAARARDSVADLVPAHLVHRVYSLRAVAAFRFAPRPADRRGDLRGKLFWRELGTASAAAGSAEGAWQRVNSDRSEVSVSGIKVARRVSFSCAVYGNLYASPQPS